MIWVNLGSFSLLLGVMFSLFAAVAAFYAAQKRRELAPLVKLSGTLTNLFVLIAFIALLVLLINDQFYVRYVAQHSNSQLPVFYKISAAWGGHEGSLLFWALLLGIWNQIFQRWAKSLTPSLALNALGVLNAVMSGFLLFILAGSSPFALLDNPPADGADLNPLLQDIGLVIHPPFLYLGYVGTTYVFALSLAALIAGDAGRAWASSCRPWALAAWGFLSIGILIGSMWAYYELGWGGWWFWDPVENASLMPWFCLTALIHCLLVVEKREVFRHWSILLSITAFALSLLGTFLVRSGVLTSVHAFASDATRGIFILMFLFLVIGVALTLYAWRAPKLQENAQRFAIFSRESLLLVNNVLLVVSCVTVMVGTLFPLFTEAFAVGQFSVGPPYFESVLAPLWLLLLILVPFGIFARWKYDSVARIRRDLLIPLVPAVMLGMTMPMIWADFSLWIGLGFSVAWWVAFSTIYQVIDRMRRNRQALWSLPKHFLGMSLGHLGLAIFVVGALAAKNYAGEYNRVIYPRQTLHVEGYDVTFMHLEGKVGSNFDSLIGHFDVVVDGKRIARLRPEKRQYFSGGEPTTETSIDRGFFRDLYMSLGEMQGVDFETSPWTVRLYYKPLMNWVWAGFVMMAIAAALSFRGVKRQKFKKEPQVKE
ncbi:Cytochrome c-type biogenesis protein CcmF [Oligella ureolytica]|uniref:Cytochrome c-type biogenesis protein CcmF n=1 Tax=Oligella ureolytica TaxID=90244 RepID=A0A378XE97_9BURK|nr:heme lyase CcmF/NrfE family subunit [Oligella ureolytica]QPT41115.1 heme lyase CcmF/NrfE family subunit [Oligella ureolytica]SUA53744.1 Cytochrome c-type biogenesis protein CcmF [Oligella ureolytica]SUA53904.1 Cytochrome c-type biogenesis protein CcmF [Oligella ureolytica]